MNADLPLVFRLHAIQRMFEREVSEQDIHHILATGRTIEAYPADEPYPSRLVMGWCESRPIHVVIAENTIDQETIIIMVYEPDPDRWEPGFEIRRL